MTSYTGDPEELRGRIDAALGTFIAERRVELAEAGDLLDEIERVVAAGGKRLRPTFCYWGYRAAGGEEDPRIVRAAITFELLHTFALVHDDIMDSSAERRGEPTSFAQLGLERALLVGDLALVLADSALLRSGFDAEVVNRAYGSYAAMQQQVIAGQYLDVAAFEGIDTSTARRIAWLKSGSYSIEGPLVVGALLAGANDELGATLRRVGGSAGEAFQLRDDVLGLFGDPATTGKSIEADIRDGKKNILYAMTVERVPATERDRFVARWGAEGLETDEIESLRALVESSGARAATEELIRELTSNAIAELDRAPIADEARGALSELIGATVDRVA
jgi:geranylgeranyl diphosphate synthase type I